MWAFAAEVTLAALIGFDVSPSYVDKDGILREPFALVVSGGDPKLKAKLLAREEQRTLKQQQ